MFFCDKIHLNTVFIDSQMQADKIKSYCQFCLKEQVKDCQKVPINRELKLNFYKLTNKTVSITIESSKESSHTYGLNSKIIFLAQYFKIQRIHMLRAMPTRAWSCSSLSGNTVKEPECFEKFAKNVSITSVGIKRSWSNGAYCRGIFRRRVNKFR